MIDIALYRIRIGSFGQKQHRIGVFKNENKNGPGQHSLKIVQMILKIAFTLCFVMCGRTPSCTAPTAPLLQKYLYRNLNQPTSNLQHSMINSITLSPHSPQLKLPDPPTGTKTFQLEDKNFLARYTYGNKRQHGIKIVHWNKGSSFLQNKRDDIESVIQKYHPHILGLSEANLFSHHDLSNVQYPEYTLHSCPTISNPDLNVSRVVVYTHSSLVVKPRPDLMDDKTSAIWLEVGLPNRHKILVCNLYREWGYLHQPDRSSHSIAAQLERWKVFISKWEQAISEDKEVIVTGDINLNSLKWMRDDLPSTDSIHKLRPLIDLLFEKIIPLGVSQQVSVATHSWPGQQDSCLDHMYSNKPDKLSDVAAHVNGGSDHKLLYVVRYAKSMRRNVRYIKKRCFKHFDQVMFMKEIQALKWFDVYNTSDVNIAVTLLTNKLTLVLDKFAPIRTIQTRSRYAPWLSDTTKLVMGQRDRAQQSAAANQDQEKWREYRNLRNRATQCIKKDKKVWEAQQLDNLRNTSVDLWRNVKGWMGWKNSGPPTQLFYQGRMETSPMGLASAMNSFFLNKVKTLRENLPPPRNDPLENLKRVMSTRSCTFSLKPVLPENVLEIVQHLKNSKSTGLDNIDVGTLKLIIKDILPAFTHVINLSLTSLTFPNLWKIAKVIPLLKKGDPLDPKNYRPVALLSILSKVLERIIFKQVVEYMEGNGLIHPSHHGSRAKHSTCTAVIEMYDSWVESVENGEMAGVMMLDLSAAFDLVDHQLLLQKLEILGFDQPAAVWMWSYLSNRSQGVYVDGKLSDLKQVNVGVPQGSVLGALLYILFVNDLPEVVHGHLGPRHTGHDLGAGNQKIQFNINCQTCGTLCCYVDDSTYMYSSSDPAELSAKLSEQYKRLAEYMGDNKLVINNDKTHLLVMGTRKHAQLRQQVSVDTGTVVVTPVETEKLLGINLHQSLKWKEHILTNDKSMIKSLTTRLNALKRVSRNATFKTRLMVANACFMSIITYMVAIWGGTENYVIRAVQVIQNRAARCVTKLSWFTPTRTLLQQCNWLSIKQLVFFHTALQVWKVKTWQCPVYIHSKLQPSNTRSAAQGNLLVPVVESALSSKSFMVRSTSTWNMLPPDIRTIQQLNVFKRKLKQWTKTNIEIE